ncbi:hypothetical protein [Sphingopyxis sp. PET50]|nr:hypothetical protein [Sphingopyxis sp. PET50]
MTGGLSQFARAASHVDADWRDRLEAFFGTPRNRPSSSRASRA